MFWKKRTYAPAACGAAECEAPVERDSLWRMADDARRRLLKEADESLTARRDRLGGHADFMRKI